MQSMVVSSSSRLSQIRPAQDMQPALLDQIDRVEQDENGLRRTLTSQPVTSRQGNARSQRKQTGQRAASSMIQSHSSAQQSSMLSQRHQTARQRDRSRRNSRQINQSIVDLVSNEDAFRETFVENSRRQVSTTVNKDHVFDSRQTMVTVGPNNLRFPFDTEEEIFAISDVNLACLKTKGDKIKPSMMSSDNCSVCRKPKHEFKNKKIAQCEFCAKFGCIDCIYKTFPFPQLSPVDKTQCFGIVCLTCETKLHINTVTSDILRALQKAELRVDARERRFQQVTQEQSHSESKVALQRRKFDEQVSENRHKTEQMQFRIGQQATKINKCEQDNANIQRHIDLRRMERENQDLQIEQLKREIETAKHRIKLDQHDLQRVKDDMTMLSRQVKVRPTIQPHQTSQQTNSVSMLTSNASCTNMSGVFGTGEDLTITDGDPSRYLDVSTSHRHGKQDSDATFDSKRNLPYGSLYDSKDSNRRPKKHQKKINTRESEGKACCKSECSIF